MRRAARTLLVSLMCISALAACKSLPSLGESRREKALLDATETYRKLIRWGYFEEASHYLRAKEGEIAAPNLIALAHYKVTDYSTGEQLENEAGDEARVIAFIDYYDLNTGVAGAVRDEQYWWFDTAQSRWYLGSPMPELGRAKK